MPQAEILYLARWLKQRAGISIDTARPGPIETRLAPVARRFGFRDVQGLLRELPLGRASLEKPVIEALTVNDTGFFRDRAQLKHFADSLLPQLLRRRAHTRRLRLWSAASSTGQEAYTLAMLLREAGLAEEGWQIELLASDLNAACIARAREGLYTGAELSRGLGFGRRLTYFAKDDDKWRIAAPLRAMVTFREFNLLDDFTPLGEMDIIFCRNVLFYFDPATKTDMLNRLATALAPDGFLFTASSEQPQMFSTAFERATQIGGIHIRPEKERAELNARPATPKARQFL